MKRSLLLLAVFLPMLLHAEEFKRLDGTVVKGTVVRAEPDGLVMQTDSGVEKVEFIMLPADVQKRFNYDPAKAEAYRASRAAAQQQSAAQRLAAVQAQIAGLEQKKQQAEQQVQQQEGATPEEAARRVLVERSVIFATAVVDQGTSKGSRVSLSVTTGRAASSLLDKDTRATNSIGEGFIWGLERASGETWQGRIYPAGYYHFTSLLGEENTLHAYALTVEDAIAHGADGRGPVVPSVDPTAQQRQLPGRLRGGTLLDK
jgi:hypothetical protein